MIIGENKEAFPNKSNFTEVTLWQKTDQAKVFAVLKTINTNRLNRRWNFNLTKRLTFRKSINLLKMTVWRKCNVSQGLAPLKGIRQQTLNRRRNLNFTKTDAPLKSTNIFQAAVRCKNNSAQFNTVFKCGTSDVSDG
jgi:hypothetical protein